MNGRLAPIPSNPTAAGQHRQKLDQIRNSLRTVQKLPLDEEDEESVNDEDELLDAATSARHLDARKTEMVRTLVAAGYDQESAFYALKLVNFRSMMDAVQVLNSIKNTLVQQHANNAGNGIPLVDIPASRPIVTVNGNGGWPERLGPAKSLPSEHQNGRPAQMHRSPTSLSPRGPSPGHGLRQSQSFGPADALQVQQAKPSPGTVIRIERNQSERIERKMATAGGERQEQQKLSRTPKMIPSTCAPSASTSPPQLGSPQPVQRIFIDPQQAELRVLPPPVYGQHLEQLNRQLASTALQVDVPHQPASSSNRSVSPLPESVAKRLKAGTYERVVKPCRAPMFRFFMEQHIEKLTQQYHERNKRAQQLSHEMEAAGLAENVKENMLRLLRQKESKYLRMRRQKMNREMFDLIRHIGIGAFGKVTLVRKKDTDQVYAMKTLVKADVIQKQQAAHVKAERDILAEANSPWIVKLFFSFQDAQNLYFIMEYVPGGDMMQLLIHMGVFPESLARFYTAELTLAVEYVHSLGFIHRDIKPDNILIDRAGHIKLTDFGLCTGLRWTHDKRHYVVYDEQQAAGTPAHLREDSFTLPAGLDQRVKLLEQRHHRKRDRAHSVVGTGNYMAPEVIQRIGHTQLCDWWSVGVILYEMVYGRPPFMSQRDDPNETQYMIVHWRRFLDLNNPMGARLSRHCVDCIARLCCDQEARLGHRGGARDIKGHAWFRGIDFANLRQSTPEYRPRVQHAEDTSNFDTFEVRTEEHAEGGRARQTVPNFIDFTFRHFFSEGMVAPMASRGPPTRPSLAPLMEAPGEGQAERIGQKSGPNHQHTQMAASSAGKKTATGGQQQIVKGNCSPLAARTILQIGGGPVDRRKAIHPTMFRPFQSRLDEEEDDDDGEVPESQC